VAGGNDGLADVPRGVAILDLDLGQGQQCRLAGTGLQRARGVADGLEVLRDAELGLVAESDHQHPGRSHACDVVHEGGAAGLALDVAALEQRLQATVAGLVERLRRRRERLVGIGAYHDAVDLG
jgi:hypothetical protein